MQIKNKELQNENEILSDKIYEISKNKSDAEELSSLKRSVILKNQNNDVIIKN